MSAHELVRFSHVEHEWNVARPKLGEEIRLGNCPMALRRAGTARGSYNQQGDSCEVSHDVGVGHNDPDDNLKCKASPETLPEAIGTGTRLAPRSRR